MTKQTIKLTYNLPIQIFLLRTFRQPSFMKKELLSTLNGKEYFGKIWISLSNLESVLCELQHQLKCFSENKELVSISVAIKTYIITWVSLSDILTSFLNAVFDFGFKTKHLSYSAILENEHVGKYGFKSIISKHRDALKYEQFKTERNAIVHEGALSDESYNEVSLCSAKASLIKFLGNDDADEAQDIFRKLLHRFVQHRLKEYAMHFKSTASFIEEFTTCTIPIIEKRIQHEHPDLYADLVKIGIVSIPEACEDC